MNLLVFVDGDGMVEDPHAVRLPAFGFCEQAVHTGAEGDDVGCQVFEKVVVESAGREYSIVGGGVVACPYANGCVGVVGGE